MEYPSVAVKEVPIPYNVPLDGLVLDPSSKGKTAEDFIGQLHWLHQTSGPGGFAEELELIVAGAATLMAAGAGTVGECLDTAVIWDRG